MKISRALMAVVFAVSSLSVLTGAPASEPGWSYAAQLWGWALYTIGLALLYFAGFGLLRAGSIPRWRIAACIVAAGCAAVVVGAFLSPSVLAPVAVLGHGAVAVILCVWVLFPQWRGWHRSA
ncbi:hypothetical protein [Zhihengliuella halotolerans]|uniref:Uncharacterized protein n=1 Tax=Zhihengliuella halotolerans TaxID=370736 RepID=A0A4Q8AFM6_9MICC|nr:hypothetical protein [Zhihengliuella halotolerans]RZU63034.1 hypothetical protein EV380_2641 [Zhihengliuella halotolerans]